MLNYQQPIKSSKDDKTGGMIFLPSVLKAFTKDFTLCEDFVSIVGDICNNGKTKKNIDILLKCPEPKESSPLGTALNFKIKKAFSEIGLKENKTELFYDNFSETLSSHVNLYDLVLRLKPTRNLHEMSEPTKGISPFSFVTQPKPLQGRFKEEIYSPDTVAKVIDGLKNWQGALEKGIYVEKKNNGFKGQVHKVGNNIRIWTEEKLDITSKLPTLISQLKKINHNFVAEFEGELWLDGKHQNRADSIEIIHEQEVSKKESNILSNFYDLIWIDGKDIHELDFKDRSLKMRATIPSSLNVKVNVPRIVKTLEDLKATVKKASEMPGSEGAMIKMSNYKHPLKPTTSQMLKFKNELSINVQIAEVHDVKGSTAKNYLTTLKDGSKLTPCGRTYNTDIHAKVGDIIRVVFVELSKYIDPSTKDIWFNFWSPRVIEKTNKADSIATANQLVTQSNGQIQSKQFPKRYKGLLEEETYISEFLNNAILWDSEEFDFALDNGWITNKLIPEQLAKTHSSEIRNADNYLIKKSIADKATICLRDSENKIKSEKIICLVEI